MRGGPEWDAELDSKLREWVAEGKSLTKFARLHGFNKAHASRRAKKLGLLLAFGAPPEATDAVKGSLAAAREEFARLALADAYAIRARLHEPETIAISGPNGIEEYEHDYPTAKSLADFTAAIDRLTKTHENMARIGSATSTDVARSALLKLQDDLRAAIDDLDPEAADE